MWGGHFRIASRLKVWVAAALMRVEPEALEKGEGQRYGCISLVLESGVFAPLSSQRRCAMSQRWPGKENLQ